MVAVARTCRVCAAPLSLPRLHSCKRCAWEPIPGPQEEFLACDAFEALYGGAVGGGKSEALIMIPLRFVEFPTFRGVLFRRTMPEHRALIDRSHAFYEGRAKFVGSPVPVWTFPSGAKIEFCHLQHEDDADRYDGHELQYLGFDELSHFTEYQYTHLITRVRSSHGVPLRVRAGTNPPRTLDGAWLLKRFSPWVDKGADYHGPRAKSGERMYFIGGAGGGQRYVPKGTLDEAKQPARARVFIQAKATDNPYNDPGYISTLLALPPDERARLLDGDWSKMDKPGALWSRDVINAGRVESAPLLYRIGIGLDPSGSHRKGSDEAGIIAAGMGPCLCTGQREEHAFVTEDLSGVLPATKQAHTSIAAYHRLLADFIGAEINYGGEWIAATIHEIDDTVNVQVEHVSKGKAIRAEPVRALYGRLVDGKLDGCRVHHVGTLGFLENEQCTFDPRTSTISPGRMDALVIVLSKLLLGTGGGVKGVHSAGERRWSRDTGMMT